VLEHALGGVSDYWHIFLGGLLLVIVLFAKGGVIGLIAGARWRMTEPVLEVRGLTKSFGGLAASDDVSLTCSPARSMR
jgi:hypothetical protein